MSLCKKVLKYHGSNSFTFAFLDCVKLVVFKNQTDFECLKYEIYQCEDYLYTTWAFVSSPCINLVSQVLLKSVTRKLNRSIQSIRSN